MPMVVGVLLSLCQGRKQRENLNAESWQNSEAHRAKKSRFNRFCSRRRLSELHRASASQSSAVALRSLKKAFQSLLPCIEGISLCLHCEHGAEHGKRNSQGKLSNLQTQIYYARTHRMQCRCRVLRGLGGIHGQPAVSSFCLFDFPQG